MCCRFLYRNIPHDKGLSALRKRLGLRQENDVTTSALVELAEVAIKNIFPFKEKTLKQKFGTAIGTEFAPSYSTLFMTDLEEETLSETKLKSYLW